MIIFLENEFAAVNLLLTPKTANRAGRGRQGRKWRAGAACLIILLPFVYVYSEGFFNFIATLITDKKYKILRASLVSALLAAPAVVAAEEVYEFSRGISQTEGAFFRESGVVGNGAERSRYLNERAQQTKAFVQSPPRKTSVRDNAAQNKKPGKQAKKKQSEEYFGSKKWEADARRSFRNEMKKREAERKAGRSVFDEYM